MHLRTISGDSRFADALRLMDAVHALDVVLRFAGSNTAHYTWIE